ncbi:MAG: hypothetical protein M1823_001883 [Watsoniomyces obsoletus]|nr:MAG: hypothetical protein M1823_001883 [Watsoniomyces obsoletus]
MDSSPDDSSPTSDIDPYSNSTTTTTITNGRNLTYNIDSTRLAKPYLGGLIGYNATFQSKLIGARILYTANTIQRPLTQDEAQAISEHSARMVALAGDMTMLGILPGIWRAYSTRSTFRFPFNALKFEHPPGASSSTAEAAATTAAAAAAEGGGVGQPGQPEGTPEKELPKGRIFDKNRFLGLRGLNAQYAWHTCRGVSWVLMALFFSGFFAQSYAATVTSVHEAKDPRLEEVERLLSKRLKAQMQERWKRGRQSGSGKVVSSEESQSGNNAHGDVSDGGDDASPTAGDVSGWDEQTSAEMAALSGRGGSGGEYETGMISDAQMSREQANRERAAATTSSIRITRGGDRQGDQASSPTYVDDDDDGFIGGGGQRTENEETSPSTGARRATTPGYSSPASRRRARVDDTRDSTGEENGGGSAWERIRSQSSSSTGDHDPSLSSSGRDGWSTTPSSSSRGTSSRDDGIGSGEGGGEKGSVWARRRERAMNRSSREE